MLFKFVFNVVFVVSMPSLLATGLVTERKLSKDLKSLIAGCPAVEAIREGIILDRKYKLTGTCWVSIANSEYETYKKVKKVHGVERLDAALTLASDVTLEDLFILENAGRIFLYLFQFTN